jgi:hypothetical protein
LAEDDQTAHRQGQEQFATGEGPAVHLPLKIQLNDDLFL